MKYLIYVLTIILCASNFFSCAPKEQTKTPADKIIETTTETEVETVNLIDYYKEQYKTENVYIDELSQVNYWILTEEKLIIVINVCGIQRSVEIPKDAIIKCEQIELGTYIKITVKTKDQTTSSLITTDNTLINKILN